jgi:hypothetical protein
VRGPFYEMVPDFRLEARFGDVTVHATGEWMVLQLREAFHEGTDGRYLVFDRDARFSTRCISFQSRPVFLASHQPPHAVAERSLRKDGFEAFGTICSTTSSFSMRPISGAWLEVIRAIITPIALTNPGERLTSSLGRSPASLFLDEGA